MVEISGELHFMSASHTPRRRVEYSNVGYDHIVRYLQWSSGGQALSKIEKSAKSCNVLAILLIIGYHAACRLIRVSREDAQESIGFDCRKNRSMQT